MNSEAPKPNIKILNDDSGLSIQIFGNPEKEELGYSERARTAILELLRKLRINEVYYVDDVFEIIDNYDALSSKIRGLIDAGKIEELKAKITDIDFDLPERVFEDNLKVVWNNFKDRRGIYFQKVLAITKEDPDFAKDEKSKRKIEEYFPREITLHKLSPSEWVKQKDDIFSAVLAAKVPVLFLFDQVLTHSPSPLNKKLGLDFCVEVIFHLKRVAICGLLTHTVSVDEELTRRKDLCKEKNIPLESFFILSKKRTDKALQFADGIKKALLNSSCEIIKNKTIAIIKKAQKQTLLELENIDAYAFDHIVIQSSFKEGVWEPQTLFRIYNFLFRRNAKEQILKASRYKKTINNEISIARQIGNVSTTEAAYDDHLELRNKELYEQSKILNGLQSPVENGDIFQFDKGPVKGKFILASQACDLMVRYDGSRKSTYGTLLRINEFTEEALLSEIKAYYKNNIMRQHYFADKYKLPYFFKKEKSVKVGIIDFNDVILVNTNVLDLVVLNKEGESKLDFRKVISPSPQLSNSWNERSRFITNYFKELLQTLKKYKAIVKTLPHNEEQMIWNQLMPKISFTRECGSTPSLEDDRFSFGIKRISRYMDPGSTLLLNRYTRHLAREAEDHDFADRL